MKSNNIIEEHNRSIIQINGTTGSLYVDLSSGILFSDLISAGIEISKSSPENGEMLKYWK